MKKYDSSVAHLLVGGDCSVLPFLSQKTLNRSHIVVLSGSGGLADCISSMRKPTERFEYELITKYADQTATAFVIEGEFGYVRLLPSPDSTDQGCKRYSKKTSIFLGVLKKCLLLDLHGNSEHSHSVNWKEIAVKDKYSRREYTVNVHAPGTKGPTGVLDIVYQTSTLHFRIFISLNMSIVKDEKVVNVVLLREHNEFFNDKSKTHLASISLKIRKSRIQVVKNEGTSDYLTISSDPEIQRADPNLRSFVVDFDAADTRKQFNPLGQDNCIFVNNDGATIASIEEVHVHVRSADAEKPDNPYLNGNLSVLRFLSNNIELQKSELKRLELHIPDKTYILHGAQNLICTDVAFQKMICELVTSQYVHIYSSKENEFDKFMNKINFMPPSLPSSESSFLKRPSNDAFKYPKEFGGRHGLLGFDWTVSSKEPLVSSGNSLKSPPTPSAEPPSASSSSQRPQSFHRAFVCIAENNKDDAETVIPVLLRHGISRNHLEESIPWESCKTITPNVVFSFAESAQNYASKEFAPQNIFKGLLEPFSTIDAWMLSSCSSSFVSDHLSLYLGEARRSYPNCVFLGLGHLENTLAALAKDFQSQEWYKSFEESIFKDSLNNNNLFLGIGVQAHQASKKNPYVPPLPCKSMLAGPLDAMLFVSNSEKIDDVSAPFHGSTHSRGKQDDNVLSSVVQFKCRFLSILRDRFQACHVCVAYIPESNERLESTELANPHNTSLINEVLFASRLSSGRAPYVILIFATGVHLRDLRLLIFFWQELLW